MRQKMVKYVDWCAVKLKETRTSALFDCCPFHCPIGATIFEIDFVEVKIEIFDKLFKVFKTNS